MGVLKQHCADLEVGLAQEHQNRVCQEGEKVRLKPRLQGHFVPDFLFGVPCGFTLRGEGLLSACLELCQDGEGESCIGVCTTQIFLRYAYAA